MLWVSVFALCLFQVMFAEKLPSFIEACSRSDPNLGKCILEHGNAAWPELSRGSKKYKIISLAPLNLAAMDLIAGNIKINFNNVAIYNLENMKIIDAALDLKEKYLNIVFLQDSTWFEGDYVIDGKISILPISGEGHAKFKHYNNTITYNAKFDYKTRNGKEYIKIDSNKVKIGLTTMKGEYSFDNLFNGNKQLTNEMNNFLTENWMDFWTEMKPTFETALVTIAQSVIDNVFDLIPMDELFLP